MKHLQFFAITVIAALTLCACENNTFGGITDYTDYQVENKTDAPLTIQMTDATGKIPDIFYSIPSNSTKTIVQSTNGNGEGYGPYYLKMVIVTYKNYVLKDSTDEGNSIINIRAYKELEKSKYKGKTLNILRFTIDSTYVKEHLK